MARYRWNEEEMRLECIDPGVGHGSPDVYFKQPYYDEHLSSEEHPGPKFITSKREKKYWLEKCKLRESGDRIHGATNFDPISHRHGVESLHRKGYRS